MLRKSLAKSSDEFLWDCMDAYRDEHGGSFRMEDMARWILDRGLLPAPQISPVRLLTRNLKQAARRRRFRDAQGRTVRKVVAAKIKRFDVNGNRMFDVVWDYLHEMSFDHALTSFSQRDDVIEKQRLAATRDVHSFLDNNPSAVGHESQFRFGFMLEEPASIIEEKIKETTVRPLPSADLSDEHQARLLSKTKPR